MTYLLIWFGRKRVGREREKKWAKQKSILHLLIHISNALDSWAGPAEARSQGLTQTFHLGVRATMPEPVLAASHGVQQQRAEPRVGSRHSHVGGRPAKQHPKRCSQCLLLWFVTPCRHVAFHFGPSKSQRSRGWNDLDHSSSLPFQLLLLPSNNAYS